MFQRSREENGWYKIMDYLKGRNGVEIKLLKSEVTI